MVDTAFFYVFALMVLGGGILTITRRNAVHAALSLIVALLGVAGIYLLQQAEFLFAVQIILYIGGVVLLMLFVIMLINLDQTVKMKQFHGQWWLALACVLAVGAEVSYVLWKGIEVFHLPEAVAAPPVAEGNTERLADVLFSQYLLPFEIASILLLVAIVGSVVMAKKRI